MFKEGERVEAYFCDGWYSGVVHVVNLNSISVQFDDGDYLEDASPHEVRAIKHKISDEIAPLFDFIQELDLLPEPQTAAVDPAKNILGNVEQFLLPSPNSDNSDSSDNKNPRLKLEDLLHQIAILDHIRILQTMYRDDDDELSLGSELRSGEFASKLSTKEIMEKLSIYKARAVALCRLAFGDCSAEMLRAEADLCGSYALRGLWSQVNEKSKNIEFSLLNKVSYEHKVVYEAEFRKAARMAKRVACVFDSLRDHVVNYSGQVTHQLLSSLHQALRTLESSNAVTDDGISTDIEDLISAIREYIATKAKATTRNKLSFSDLVVDTGNGVNNTRSSTSWGEMVNYLRYHCPIMKRWILNMQEAILPQNAASLRLAFNTADTLKRGTSHPQLLANKLSLYPGTARVLSGTSVVHSLSQIRVEVPLYIDTDTYKVCDIAAIENNQYKLQDTQRVTYELPVSWEEFLALYVIDMPHNCFDLLRVQVLVLMGMSEIFSNQLAEAEDHMVEALHILESLEFEMEVYACELYNSIAQMMIMKHKEWQSEKPARCKRAAEDWITSAEGVKELADEIKLAKLHYRQKKLPISDGEVESRSRTVLLKARTALLMEIEEDTSLQSVEASFRYLVRSLDILEKAHNTHFHPAVATACLAVASVQNMCGQFESAREWLVKCVRIFEKLQPIPSRAIAFVNVQLSNVLLKLGHDEGAIKILSEALNFYLNKSREGLIKHSARVSAGSSDIKDSALRRYVFPYHEPVVSTGPSSTCYYDVLLTAEYTKKLISMNSKISDSGKYMSIEKCIVLAELIEVAFGWDSKEAAKVRKEIGDRCWEIKDFTRAYINYKLYFDICTVVFGENDKKTIDAAKLLQNAANQRNGALVDATAPTD